MQWGIGFLSPGGPEKVAEILKTVDVAGKSVLDIGCGVGGPAMVIAEELGATDVVGIDIEEYLIETAQENVLAAGLGDRVSMELVEEDPLPFADGRFDIVFSKDSLIHVPDKSALYTKSFAYLRPVGSLPQVTGCAEKMLRTWMATKNGVHIRRSTSECKHLPKQKPKCEMRGSPAFGRITAPNGTQVLLIRKSP